MWEDKGVWKLLVQWKSLWESNKDKQEEGKKSLLYKSYTEPFEVFFLPLPELQGTNVMGKFKALWYYFF